MATPTDLKLALSEHLSWWGLRRFETDEAYFRWNMRLLRTVGLVNFLDGCAASLPCQARGAAPVGLMVCGTAMSDRRTLAVAAAVERALAGS